MKKEHLAFIFCFFWSYLLQAQTVADTSIYIPVVELTGSKSNQAPGMVVNKIDSAAKQIHHFNSVAELISIHSTVSVRSYGNGLTSTVNARGLGGNHTSVLWNGVPLNSSNLGLTDLSLLPAFLFDEVAIVSGGTGSVYGNNAMGTAIELNNNPANKTELELAGITGSYSNVGTRILFNYGLEKFQSSTGFFIYESKNDFSFENVSRAGAPEQKQLNAKQNYKGLIQTFNYKLNKRNNLKVGLWYQYSRREIPPLMITSRGEEVQRDSSLRFFGEWKKTFNKVILSNRNSYFNEFIFYDNYFNGIKGRSDVKNYRHETELKYYHRKFTINAAVSGDISKADIAEYEKLQSITRMGINLNSKYNLKNNWVIGGGFKKEFTDLADSPIAYTAGLDGAIVKKYVFISANISKIYTLPTLNDLYWKPGGNESLRPEDGINTQLNIKYLFAEGGSLSCTGFNTLIDDWIQWLPNSSGLYSPINIKKVESKGIEATLKQYISYNKWNFSFTGNYAFTNTINKSFEGNPELVNKQLIYVPQHLFNAFLLLAYDQISFYSSLEYTGARYTTADNSSLLDPYYLVNTGMVFNFKYDLLRFIIKPEIKNVFDVAYQPIPWRAMPGRSYFLTLNLNLNFKHN